MKKSLIAIFFFLGFSLTAQAKFINIKTNALALAFGGLNVTANIALGSTFSVGAGYSKVSSGNAEATGTELNVEIFFDDFSKDGWFIEGFYQTATAKGTVTTYSGLSSSTTTTEATATSVGGMFAYQWMWSTFNQSLGLGYQQFTIDSSASVFSGLSGGLPVISYRIGLAF